MTPDETINIFSRVPIYCAISSCHNRIVPRIEKRAMYFVRFKNDNITRGLCNFHMRKLEKRNMIKLLATKRDNNWLDINGKMVDKEFFNQ